MPDVIRSTVAKMKHSEEEVKRVRWFPSIHARAQARHNRLKQSLS
jgi:hypothetical protein